MKNKIKSYGTLSLLLFFCILSTRSNAQLVKPEFGKKDLSPHGVIETSWYNIYWFYEGSVGARLLGSTSSGASLSTGLNLNAGAGYYFSERFGLKGRIDYHRFSFTPGMDGQKSAKGGAVSLSFEALSNVLHWFNPGKFGKWRLALHAGAGLTSYSNRAYKDYRNKMGLPLEDPAINGNDDMGHVLLGVTPQYHINGRCTISIDISTFILFKQDFTFDRYNEVRHKGVGDISTISLSLSFRP